MRRLILIGLLCLTGACGRPLTEPERAYVADLTGSEVDADKVRIMRGGILSVVQFRFPARPRVTCQERLFPPSEEKILTGSPAAAVLHNWIYFNRGNFLPDYVPEYPERFYLYDAMVFGHETVHVWQWQNRDKTGFTPLRAVREHQLSDDPYLFDIDKEQSFSDFGYEQQGSVMEEFICCQALAPHSARTDRLRELLRPHFPVARLEKLAQSTVIPPFDSVDLGGICD
ncbi:hypothetical protein IV417_14590 [Alphaproteobacteria bacterium KMM 3653]|uniref:Lipoprotein n=1 Tax=Harenicola maris TaxID=2841044 RepID=A0AAP2G4S8_9RHOB|nr:hypothetical protein [Harenicola maris]